MIKIEFSGDASTVMTEMAQMLAATDARSEPPVARPAPEPTTPEEPAQAEALAETPTEEPASEPAGRMYGKADEGKSRRTKVQIAEDEEIEALASKLGANLEGAAAKHPASIILAELRSKAESEPEETAGISTGEERTDPAQEETSALTREDVRDAMGRYVEAHGMPAMQKNGPELLGYAKLSEIPEDPEAFAAAIERLDAAAKPNG